MVAGGVPSVNLAALSAFLLTGQSSREVKDLSHDKPKRATPAVASTSPGTPTQTGLAQGPAVAAKPGPAAGPAAEPSGKAAPGSSAPSASVGIKDPGARPQLDAKPALKPAESTPGQLIGEPGGGAPRPAGRSKWMGPAAIGAGILAVGLGAYAVQQKGAADRAYSKAEDQLRNDGTFKDPAAQARWGSLREEGSRNRRNAAISGGASVGLAVTAAILGWNAWRSKPQNVAMLTVEF